MKGIPTELLYLLAFVAYIVFTVYAQRAARRRQAEEEALTGDVPPTEPEAAATDDEVLDDVWGRRPAPAEAAVPAAVIAPRPAAAVYVEPPRRRGHPVHALLRNRRDLHRAIVLMTILGPCRAEEPPDTDR